jgi:hypothetical protein
MINYAEKIGSLTRTKVQRGRLYEDTNNYRLGNELNYLRRFVYKRFEKLDATLNVISRLKSTGLRSPVSRGVQRKNLTTNENHQFPAINLK